MTGKERINAIFAREKSDRVGFWSGDPPPETREIYYKYFGVSDPVGLAVAIGDDAIWLPAEFHSYRHPESKWIWNTQGSQERKALDAPGIFAEYETLKDVEGFDWPDAKYLDFTNVIQQMNEARKHGIAVFGGPWTYITALACEFFGMENLFISMYTKPELVHAAIDGIVEFYLAANKKFFDLAADKLDVFFFGNDLGSQENLLLSPEMFNKFFLPGIKKIVDQAKGYGLKVMLHSCGAVEKLVPTFIDIGIDALHPLQAKARGMDAQNLADKYKNDLVFVGGVCAQDLLPFGTPEEIKAEVRRLKKIFGKRYVVSPSHEALLPNVSPENMLAMRDAAIEA